LELSGTPEEVAFQMGRRRAGKIAVRVEYWNRLLSRLYAGQKTALRSMERGFLAAARKGGRRYLDEIAAIAEGAGLPFEDVFRLNLTELRAYADKCTTLIFPYGTKSRRGVLLAHNEDWDPKRNDVFLLKAELPGVRYAIVAYDGHLPGLSCGVNS